MRQLIDRFIHDEAGAITVDWVVLTAAMVGLGIAVVTAVATGATDHATGIGAHVGSISLSTP
jgi:Flp pilus assembly pilin Flp